MSLELDLEWSALAVLNADITCPFEIYSGTISFTFNSFINSLRSIYPITTKLTTTHDASTRKCAHTQTHSDSHTHYRPIPLAIWSGTIIRKCEEDLAIDNYAAFAKAQLDFVNNL